MYNASQDDGYLGAGCRADDAASWVWCACVCGVCSRLGGKEVKLSIVLYSTLLLGSVEVVEG